MRCRYCEEMPPELLAERWMLRELVKEMSQFPNETLATWI